VTIDIKYLYLSNRNTEIQMYQSISILDLDTIIH